jgi:CHAD domain-containing protein
VGMKKDLLNKYINDHLNSVIQHLTAYSIDRKAEHLHLLRVDIKKIDAIVSFAEDIYHEKYETRKLNPLFRKAGEIRELQINIHQLGLLPHQPLRLVTKLKKQEMYSKEQFLENIYRYSKNLKDFRGKITLPSRLPKKSEIAKYFRREIKKTNLLVQNFRKKDIHKFRIRIKQLLYEYTALPVKMQRKINLNKSYINKLQKRIGDWHDKYAAINFLTHKKLFNNTSEYISILKKRENKLFIGLMNELKGKTKSNNIKFEAPKQIADILILHK